MSLATFLQHTLAEYIKHMSRAVLPGAVAPRFSHFSHIEGEGRKDFAAVVELPCILDHVVMRSNFNFLLLFAFSRQYV